jgi:hypothetical protein
MGTTWLFWEFTVKLCGLAVKPSGQLMELTVSVLFPSL